ncbi:hypothetical protein NQ315_006477 [Exocentrus adspersus]|uniref:Uncharacterized protein n=1 Tax=Exocentrus adspersus TaxID=1586481 RepID=A0AAV8W019_9CUCU|nr:hypothetical protein NQ315_006477 [Exocentrus adspersus]
MDNEETPWCKASTGKLKRQRKKLHIPAKTQHLPINSDTAVSAEAPSLPLSPLKDGLFSGLNIDVDTIRQTLVPDDVQSIKSYKSLKSESGKPILPKKEKIKLRRELLLKKIDTVNQMKKELKLREKRRKTALIGDTNPLHDALPSLESLLQSHSNRKPESKKNRGIEKAKQRKRKLVEGVKVFKQALKNKEFKKNPFGIVSNHVKAVVEQERKSRK